MFVRIATGHTTDPRSLREGLERWMAGLPEDAGHIGTTAGVGEDGTYFVASRYGSRDEADRSGSPTTDREATVFDCPLVETYMGEIPARSGFVQIEIFEGLRDEDEYRDVCRGFHALRDLRPDLLGTLVCYAGDGNVFAVNHFTSEEDARAAESGEPPFEVIALEERWAAVIDRKRYLDIREPWMYRAPAGVR